MSGDHVTKKWVVEDTWRCASCGAVNRGRELKCVNCGSPREKNEAEVASGPNAPAVIDPKLLKLATAGAHWVCKFCQAQERALNGTCANCGAKVDEGDAPKAPPPARSPVKNFVDGRVRPRSGDDESTERVDVRPKRSAPLPPTNLRPRRSRFGIALLVVAIALFVGSAIWVFVPHHVVAMVSRATWKHESFLHERRVAHESGWGQPSGAFNAHCERRFKQNEDCHPHDCRPHQERYQCGSHDCNCRNSCTSNKNGFSNCSTTCSTCADYCSRTVYDTCYDQCPVYDDWCEYDRYVWPVIDQQSIGGEGAVTSWPPLEARGELQRLERTGAYSVTFASDGYRQDTWSIRPPSLDEYLRYRVGAKWELKVNHAGQVWPQHEVAP